MCKWLNKEGNIQIKKRTGGQCEQAAFYHHIMIVCVCMRV